MYADMYTIHVYIHAYQNVLLYYTLYTQCIVCVCMALDLTV